jgi:uncharacterized protein (DUF2235 family)
MWRSARATEVTEPALEPKPSAGSATKPKAEGRNLIVCCDGTGNEVTGNLSNVLKLFRIAVKDGAQRVYYHPGVGTVGTQNDWQRLKTNLRSYWGLATGTGLDENILDAYRWLLENYREDTDRIFLFGFSRGAYTARALAGLIHLVGLLHPDQSDVADYALTTYKRVSARVPKSTGEMPSAPTADTIRAGASQGFTAARQFKRVMNSRSVPIHFMGVWDTVGSMIVPGRYPLTFTLRTLPFTRKNPSVRAFRHAMAIDERRRMFRLNRWDEGQKYEENHWAPPAGGFPNQDCKQLWFAGVHSDIGGGYPEAESGLAAEPLIWMVEEAEKHGLRISRSMLGHLAKGKPLPGGHGRYVAPNPRGPMHRSLHGFWWLLEWLPKSTYWREWRRGFLGFYFPRAEPRPIPLEDELHPSVQKRLDPPSTPDEARAKGLVYPPYDPPNLHERRPLQPPEGRFGPFARKVLGAIVVAAILLGLAWAGRCWWEHRHRHHRHHHGHPNCMPVETTTAGDTAAGRRWLCSGGEPAADR